VKVRIEMNIEMESQTLFSLMKHFESPYASNNVTFGEGQSTIEANAALRVLIAELRRQLVERR
jgi:hypothetical protein